ncbi:hypothetical protein [Arthrobacter oryzae]|uniref:hypothetical protein n=1 Tax=Arthrobacter oryzae TaxID=409290 RepID=UPI00273ABE4A|nr:hypothetical protein [Arthrobacter oryzae]WLQ05131.1 hypothetical protein Q8Z05_13350 [Arthrobacter oryzae]
MERLSWRALRPVLLAGAAATAWLTLSAPAASANAASDPGSLVGGVSSSVSSVAEAATSPVGDILAAAASSPTAVAAPPGVTVLPAQPSSTEPAGLVQPLTGAVDHVIAAVPVVNQIVPTGNISAVTAPVIDAADGIVAGIAQEVLPAAGDTLPVLEPVVEPVSDLLDGVDSLPDNIAAPVLTVPDAAGGASNTPAAALPLRADTESAGGPAAAYVTSMAVAPFSAADSGTLRSVPAETGSVESPGPREGSPGPAEIPAVPGSGSGSGQSSSGGAGGAAWLSTFYLDVPLTGVFPVSGPLQNAPTPVSFDPGSTPD